MRNIVPALTLLLAAPLSAQEPGGGVKVYQQAVPSVVWVQSTRDRGLATGSGSLIDPDRRLVLTNYHVVEDNPKATVFFPQFRNGQPISERDFYIDRARRFAIPGRVVALDKGADLAIIQIDSVPEKAEGIPLAPATPTPGENVHAIGNTGKSGALWGYVKGTVRQVYRKKWKARLDRNRTLTFEARVIETDSATNPGDSGGPLLNDRGQLVGVIQGGAVDAQLVSTFVDVSEVKRLLASRAVQVIRGGNKPESPLKRSTPLPVADRAKLFSGDAVTAAEKEVSALHRADLDVLIETYPTLPKEWADKLAEAGNEGRQAVFRELAQARLRAEKANGVMVLVSVEPRYVMVEIDRAVQGRFPEKYAQKVADALIEGLRQKKPDAGLSAALKLIRDGYQETAK